MDSITRAGRAVTTKGSALTLWVRPWIAGAIAMLAVTSIPQMDSVVQPSGVANADVCASVGRRVAVSGCTNVADTFRLHPHHLRR